MHATTNVIVCRANPRHNSRKRNSKRASRMRERHPPEEGIMSPKMHFRDRSRATKVPATKLPRQICTPRRTTRTHKGRQQIPLVTERRLTVPRPGRSGAHQIEMAVPISPEELSRRRIAIVIHQLQEDKALFRARILANSDWWSAAVPPPSSRQRRLAHQPPKRAASFLRDGRPLTVEFGSAVGLLPGECCCPSRNEVSDSRRLK
jgi:hypothetical protein